MGANRLLLIQNLQSTPFLDERFTNIRVVNCDPLTGEHYEGGGVLSVVFKADDVTTGQPVAIKFFDPDHQGPRAYYRFELFQREADLLQRLLGRDRCLQILQPLRELPLSVTDTSSGRAAEILTHYFVVEWIERDINDYFLRQQDFDALTKLRLFREACLAVFALHRNGIYHRDLKPDNLRIAMRNGISHGVAIDLGTAAAYDSPSLGSPSDYRIPVGAGVYAPIEAHCGLAGIRGLGSAADMYALGCMLHDLFNINFLIFRLSQDNGFQMCLGVCHLHVTRIMHAGADEAKLLKEWDTIIKLSKRQVTIPSIDGPGGSVPASIRDLLGRLLQSLAAVDLSDRISNHDQVIRYIDSAIRILGYEAAQKRRADARRALKLQRQEKLTWSRTDQSGQKGNS